MNVEVDFPMVCLPLDRLDRLLLEHLQHEAKMGLVEILFEHRVLGVKQANDGESASVEVEYKTGEKTDSGSGGSEPIWAKRWIVYQRGG